MVEHILGKDEVIGSNPIVSSIPKPAGVFVFGFCRPRSLYWNLFETNKTVDEKETTREEHHVQREI
jgi:hypothetical protein